MTREDFYFRLLFGLLLVVTLCVGIIIGRV